MANDADDDARPTDRARAKERSPNFPFINLETAIRRALEFYQEERRGSAPYSVTVSHWGYAEASSSGQQTVGALRSYGLMEDQGRGSDRRLRLSDSALRILLDDRPDSMERDQLMKAAAKSPPILADIYERWPDGPPSDANLRHYLLFDRHFSEDAARRVVAILKDNEHLVGLFGHVSLSSSNENSSDIIDVPATALLMDKTSQLMASPPLKPASGVRVERIIGPNDLDILLQFNGDPTRESYEFIKEYIELRLKSMKSKED